MQPRAYAQLDDFEHVSDSFDASAKYSHVGTHVRVDTSGTKHYVKPMGVSTDIQLATPKKPVTGGAVDAATARRGQLSNEAALALEQPSEYSAEEVKLRTAIAEVVGQEILRKFLPETQPKYQLGIDKGNPPQVYVICESVPGLKKPEPDALKNKNFGKLIALCLFLGETDLKLGNLGQDDKGRPVKIDGDWLLTEFSKRCDPKRRGIEIKPDSALYLPSLNPSTNPKVFHWGDQYKATFAGLSKPKLFTPDLRFHPEVIKGIKEGFSEICEWKDDQIKTFVKEVGVAPPYAEELSGILIQRRNAMRLAHRPYLEHIKKQIATTSSTLKDSTSSSEYESLEELSIARHPTGTSGVDAQETFKRLQALNATDTQGIKDQTQEKDQHSSKAAAPAVQPDTGQAKKATPQTGADEDKAKKPKPRFGGSY